MPCNYLTIKPEEGLNKVLSINVSAQVQACANLQGVRPWEGDPKFKKWVGKFVKKQWGKNRVSYTVRSKDYGGREGTTVFFNTLVLYTTQKTYCTCQYSEEIFHNTNTKNTPHGQ